MVGRVRREEGAMAVTEVAAPDAPAAKQAAGMLQSVHIRNFRGLKDLKVEGLGRINVFAGRNNSGKTALLEALSLLAGAGWPNLAFHRPVARGADVLAEAESAPGSQVSAITVRESIWKPMFHGLDLRGIIEVEARHSRLGKLSLIVDFARQKNVEIKVGNLGGKSVQPLQDTLGFVYTSRGTGKVTSQAFLDDQSQTQAVYTGETDADLNLPFPSAHLSSSRASGQLQDTRNLGEVRRRKQGDRVLKALRIIEPRLESIEENSSSGVPMIWGDIGFDELVPLSAMGEGLARAARLFIGMIHVQKGVVMVDEIENGFHYSVVPGIWEAIDQVSRDFNVQVFATTHSRECVRAAYKALGDEGFVYHRLRADEDGNRCVTYDPIALSGSLHHNFEIR